MFSDSIAHFMKAGGMSLADFPPFSFLSIFNNSECVGGSTLTIRVGLSVRGGLKLGLQASSFGEGI